MVIYIDREICNTSRNTAEADITAEILKSNSSDISKALKHLKIFDLDTELILFNECLSEDVEAHLITSIKHLITTLKSDILSLFYDAPKKAFPILKILLKYSHHPDVMIKNAARISLLILFQKSDDKALEHIISEAIPEHIGSILLHLKQIALDMQYLYAKCNAIAMKKLQICYQEELEYIDDILKLNNSRKQQTIVLLLTDFILPFIFTAIINEKQQVIYTSPVSCRIGLYLLFQLLQTITDFETKEYIVGLIFQEEIITSKQTYKNKKHTSCLQITNSLQFILLKNKTDIDALYALNILYIFQTHILESSDEFLKHFYKRILHILSKLFRFHYQCNHNLECLKLKLLFSLCKPLLRENNNDDEKWLKLKIFFLQAIENAYSDICMLIQNKIINLVNIIDKEYDVFTNMKLDSRNFLNNSDNLINNNERSDNKLQYEQTILHYFFHIRRLYLSLKNKREIILPIIKEKEKIGKIVSTDNCIYCKKLIYGHFYSDNHFLKLTDRQLLILQNTENGKEEGIVIFNSYYKDICWSTHINNVLKISEEFHCTQNQFADTTKSVSIQIEFNNKDDFHFTSDILSKAKKNQNKMARRKLQSCLKFKNKKSIKKN